MPAEEGQQPGAGASKRRNFPSPLQEASVPYSSTSSQPSQSMSQQPRITQNGGTIPPPAARAPNPSKKFTSNAAFDELKSAINRDALREQQQQATQEANTQQPVQRTISPPVLAAAPQISPPTSPTMPSSSSKHSISTRADPRPIMPRNPSIDSTVSSISNTSASQKLNGANALRVSQEPAGPQDVAALLAAAGSPELAIQKLLNEKNQAASHNNQLWRLVEKQRAMILGLNRDLEKLLKEKDRYRKKLKENLVESQSAPSLTAATRQLDELARREDSRSPAIGDGPTMLPVNIRDMSMDSRKVSDTSEVASIEPGRSDTPQSHSNVPSSALPATPRSPNKANVNSRDFEPLEAASAAPLAAQLENRVPAPIYVPPPPTSPRLDKPSEAHKSPVSAVFGHKKNASITSTATASPPASASSFSNPKHQATRKAPPAALNLHSPQKTEAMNVTNNIVDASDSEYEDDPDSARAEQMTRGRRKTREEDDEEREAIAQKEFESRSRSKKDKKSKSKSKPAEVPSDMPDPTGVDQVRAEAAAEQAMKSPAYQHSDPAAMVRQKAVVDAGLPKSVTAPALMSPGLPMSPRPGDRPMNSPMPRAANRSLNSMPMSPKSGMVGLPLSPRAPRQAIPMPPQTPLSFASPHLARAEAYHQQSQPSLGSLANQLKTSPGASPEQERPATSGDPVPMTPGEIYSGLVTDQYPDLLLPPNALPSIYVKTASSRMRPSRISYIAPKQSDENPVFTLAVHARSDNKQLWRVEKTFAALAQMDENIKAVWNMREKLPDKALFAGHAPAKIDARRVALDTYFNRMLESVTEEKAAKVVCKFLSTDAIGAVEGGDYFGRSKGSIATSVDGRSDSPQNKMKYAREGYLTKRGKNFGGWKARYFVLDGPALKYFDNRGGAQLGSIKLQNAQIGKQSNNAQNAPEDEDNQFRHAFLILEPKKKDTSALVRHVLCAESDEERDSWVDVLLQYVDQVDNEDGAAGKAAIPETKPDVNGARSPRLQKSLNDLRPSSRNREAIAVQPEPLRAVGYSDTIAGEAPVIGSGTTISRKVDTPSPPSDASFGPAAEQQAPNHPNISGPTNLQVISNTGDWGMKPPPTPQGKDKKRSIFHGFRGRSSSDLAPGEKGMASPGMAPQDHYATRTNRAVFGVPLAEAVEFARPVDVVTELPAIVYRCIEYLLMKNAIKEEGIFRLSGSNTVIKALKDRFNTEGDINLAADNKYHDIHAVASLLKLYLRELPSSILTRELHLEFLQCLEMHGRDKIVALNVLVNKLPRPNWALLEALSSFLLAIVNNADVNKMTIRNVGIVFAPTLNVPAPLISSFVEDQADIFGPAMDEAESPIAAQEALALTAPPTDLRSPRKQMFSDLPTPAYNQQTFGTLNGDDNTGFAPIHPTYAQYQMAPQGDGGFGSLNDALRSPTVPTVYSTAANGVPSTRDVKAKRRESGMLGFSLSGTMQGISKKSSMSKLREEEGTSF